MKKMKNLLVAISIFVATSASAQFANVSSNNPKSSSELIVNECNNYSRLSIGYSVQSSSISGGSYDYYSPGSYNDKMLKSLPGLKIGYIKGVNVTGKKIPLFIEVGGELNFYAGKKNDFLEPKNNYYYEDDYDDYGAKSMILSIDIPVNIAYKLTTKYGVWIEPYLGIAFNYNLIGKTHYSWDEDWKWFDQKEYDGYETKRFQFNKQFGVNLGYKSVNLNIGYHWDSALCVEKHSVSEDGKLSTKGVIIAIGYNF